MSKKLSERIRMRIANPYIRVCLLICILLNVTRVEVWGFTVDGISYETISDSTCKVVAGNEAYEGSVNVPSEVSYNSVAYKVTAIGDQAFLNCGELMDVKLPETLEEIGVDAFGNCYALTVISIPDSVKRVDKSAFIGSNLQDLYIGDCINQIGMSAFSFVPSVHLTSSITKINDVAFEDADDLRYIYIPSSVKEMEVNAFAFCGNLQGVYIDDLANWCEIKFGNHHANPTSKAGGIWINGNYLTNLVVPDGVKSINDYAFYGCQNIYELKLSDTVEKIGKCAFKECGSIPTIHVGRGLRYIGREAIWGNGINTVYTDDINAFSQIDVEEFIFNQWFTSELICDGRLVTKINLSEGVEHIGKNVFCNYGKLASITMPNSVKSIGESAFFCCTGLIKATLSDSIRVIPRYCFGGTPSLSNLHLPSGLKAVEEYAFEGVPVSKIVLPSSTEILDQQAFCNCKADTIILSDNIRELKEWTFRDCNNLKYIYLGKSMERIDGSCFCRCRMLSSLELPESMEFIGIDGYDYPDLKSLYCHSSKPYQAYFPLPMQQQAILYVPHGCKEAFLNDYQWKEFRDIVEMEDLGAVDGINGDISPDAPIDIYDCSGRLVSDSMEKLRKGVYIVKQGILTKKIVVK